MRYRIKIVSYNDGSKEFFSQVKKFIGWNGLTSYGNEFPVDLPNKTMADALECIENHRKNEQEEIALKNRKVVKIEFKELNI